MDIVRKLGNVIWKLFLWGFVDVIFIARYQKIELCYNIHSRHFKFLGRKFTFPTMLNHTSYLVGTSTLLLQHPPHTHSINVNTTLSTMCLSKFYVVPWVLLFIFVGEKKVFLLLLVFRFFLLSLAISWFKVRKLKETFFI